MISAAPARLPAAGRRRVTVLGSTGSVGRRTVELLAASPERFVVEALVANSNVGFLAEQVRRTGAAHGVVADEARYGELKEALGGTATAAAGPAAVAEAAARPCDLVMAAVVGAAGLAPTLAAVRQGAVVALANKESLVCAGDLLVAEAGSCGTTLLPVDSEHSAIFQVLESRPADDAERLILTASGGPFRTWSLEAMAGATPAQATEHPNWEMGRKISVDSATMMNKGLELIEASHLFSVAPARIDVLVHPQSVVHSLVAYSDGSVLAQLGTPDMRTPIAYALAWPERMAAPVRPLDLAAIARLDFSEPDCSRFPALRLARQALDAGNGSAVVLNAANEVAVARFLDGAIGFLDIAAVVEDSLATVPARRPGSVDDVLALDDEARRTSGGLAGRRGRA